MIAVNIGAINISLAKLQKLRKKVADTADGVYRQKLYRLGELALYVSPQFSGDFVSNWNFAVDGNMPVYRPGGRDPDMVMRETPDGQFVYTQTPKKAGDTEFIKGALSRLAGQLQKVTIHSNVHLVNATDLDTDGTRMIGPDGAVNLRQENIIPGHVRIEQYLRTHVKNMPK